MKLYASSACKRKILLTLCLGCLVCANAPSAGAAVYQGPLTGLETGSGAPPVTEKDDARLYDSFQAGDAINGGDTGKGYFAAIDVDGAAFRKNMALRTVSPVLNAPLTLSADASARPGNDAYGLRWDSQQGFLLAPGSEVYATAGQGDAYAFASLRGGRVYTDILAEATTERGNAYGLYNCNHSVMEVEDALLFNNIQAVSTQAGNAYAAYNADATMRLGDDTTLEATSDGIGDAFAVYNAQKGRFLLGSDFIFLHASANSGNAYGIYNTGESAATVGNDILLEAQTQQSGDAYGIVTDNASSIAIGNDAFISASGTDNACGIVADNASSVALGDDASISADASNGIYLISLDNNSAATLGKNAQIGNSILPVLSANHIYGAYLDHGSALFLGDQSTISVEPLLGGNPYAIYARNNSTVTIDGALTFDNAAVDLGDHSILTGALTGADFIGSAVGSVALRSGSIWNNTGDSSFLQLFLQDGMIRQAANASLTVADAYQGNGSIALSSFAHNPVSFGSVLPQSDGQSSVLTLTARDASVDTSDATAASTALKALAHNLSIQTSSYPTNLDATAQFQSTPLTPKASAAVVFAPDATNTAYYGTIDLSSVAVGDRMTDSLRGIRAAQSSAYLACRILGGDLNKRFSELHSVPSGARDLPWVRTYGGRMKRGGADALRSDYYAVQIGYDRPVRADETGTYYLGYAADYLRADDTYLAGDGKNTAGALSVYGSWVGKRGQYLDLALRGARVNSDYGLFADGERSSGHYHNWLFGLSAEYGRRFDAGGGWFFEPQAQLVFAAIDGARYTSANGIRVAQDDVKSLIGRLGVRAGRALNSGGLLYLRASALREFDGEGGATLSRGAIRASYEQDLGDTWYEFGLGGVFPLAPHSQGYFELAKTASGKFDASLQWSAGCRWSF